MCQEPPDAAGWAQQAGAELSTHFKAVLVAALFLAHLAVPTELLQPLGLDRIADRLQPPNVVLGHSLYVYCERYALPP